MNEDREALFYLTHQKCIHEYRNGNIESSFWLDENGNEDGEWIVYDEEGNISEHGWWEKAIFVADFIRHPELKKEYGIE